MKIRLFFMTNGEGIFHTTCNYTYRRECIIKGIEGAYSVELVLKSKLIFSNKFMSDNGYEAILVTVIQIYKITSIQLHA